MPPKHNPFQKRSRDEKQPAIDPQDLSDDEDGDSLMPEDDFVDMDQQLLTDEGLMMFGDEGVVFLNKAERAQLLAAGGGGAIATAAGGGAGQQQQQGGAERLFMAGGEGATARDGQMLLTAGGGGGGGDEESDEEGDELGDLDEEDLLFLDEMFGGDYDRQEQFIKEFTELKKKEKEQLAQEVIASAAAAGGGGGDDDDDDDGSSVASQVNVNFSVDQMIPEDVPIVANFLDGTFFPDPEREAVDLPKFAAAIQKRGLGTSMVMTEQQEDDEEDGDDDDEKKVDGEEEEDKKEDEPYGVLSMLRFTGGGGDNNNQDVVKFLESSNTLQPVAGVSDAGAAAPGALLRAGNGALIVSQLFSQLPPLLVSRLYSCFVAEVTDSISQQQNKKGGGGGNNSTSKTPTHLVFLSRVATLPAESTQDKTCLSVRGDESAQANKARGSASGSKKARVEKADESAAAASGGQQHVQFARFEEEVFYRNRDAAATSVLMGRYTRDPADNKRCVIFAIKWANFCSSVKQLETMVAQQQ